MVNIEDLELHQQLERFRGETGSKIRNPFILRDYCPRNGKDGDKGKKDDGQTKRS
jgi:hypothetical protein